MKFEFYNPVHLIFGVSILSQLDEVVRKHGKKALIVISGGPVQCKIYYRSDQKASA